GSLTWGQKKHKKKDSGFLYHCVGLNGADYGAWMRSQEFQIEEGNCGDYWGVAGGMEDIPATKNVKGDYVYEPAGKMYTFKEGGEVGRHCMKRSDAEKQSGEWNTLDFYCFGDTSIHMINGKVMMVLFNSRQNEKGQLLPLKKGKIQIQSEGAEVFYKQIQIQAIDRLPVALIK
ncbi:MAG: 3-keto-disaccharide hydrolase, partial [Segetibacter sp.]